MSKENPWATPVPKSKSGMKPVMRPGKAIVGGGSKSMLLKGSFLRGFEDEIEKSAARFSVRLGRGLARVGQPHMEQFREGLTDPGTASDLYTSIADPIRQRVKSFKRKSKEVVADLMLNSPTGGGQSG